MHRQNLTAQCVKRIIDILVAGVTLVITLPIMMLVAVAIMISLGRPVLFRQERPGLHGRPFDMLKFRTMSNATDPEGQLLADEVRLGRLGRFLRETSLDELPELWNIVRGDMSLVGPRPLLMRYMDRYSSEQLLRFRAKPGLTGWAQIKGRNSLSWEEKLALDCWYVDHQSTWLDVKILLLTFPLVIARRGISAAGHSTMPEFMGNHVRQQGDQDAANELR